jgi:hypothetical protein
MPVRSSTDHTDRRRARAARQAPRSAPQPLPLWWPSRQFLDQIASHHDDHGAARTHSSPRHLLSQESSPFNDTEHASADEVRLPHYAGFMAESTRLPLRTRRILERILAEPDAEWTTDRLRDLPNAPERAVDQAIEILLEMGVASTALTGGTVRLHQEHHIPRIPEYRYQLTSDGPRALALALEASRSRTGAIASFFLEGGDAAAVERRRLRDRNAAVPHFWQRRRRLRAAGTKPVEMPFDNRSPRALGFAIRLRNRNRPPDG